MTDRDNEEINDLEFLTRMIRLAEEEHKQKLMPVTVEPSKPKGRLMWLWIWIREWWSSVWRYEPEFEFLVARTLALRQEHAELIEENLDLTRAVQMDLRSRQTLVLEVTTLKAKLDVLSTALKEASETLQAAGYELQACKGAYQCAYHHHGWAKSEEAERVELATSECMHESVIVEGGKIICEHCGVQQ